jgi:hypothetical protein
MSSDSIYTIIWDRFDQNLTDPNIPDNGDTLATFYINNYIQAIQALHNMKLVIYKIVEKYGLSDDNNQRLRQIHTMTEEDFRIYNTADFIINSGNSLINLKSNLNVLAEIRKKIGSLENFNNMSNQERQRFLDTIINS